MNTKRIIIWCLVLLVLLNPVSSVHAEDGSEDTVDLIDTFFVTTTQEDHTLHVPFSRFWFDADARIYNHSLAKASLGLATFAFHLFSAALHYIALSMLASTGSGITLQGIMQEPAVKAAETCPPPGKGV